tara:strand:+ start:158 stop:1063 length:906 start_codon:yes stop_codon:yes gene_type:complete
MKLLKLSLLINYLRISKNTKKAIFIINFGIFLSIFAASSAIISLFIENKVSSLEFEHTLYSKEKKYYERSIDETLSMSNKLNQFQFVENSHTYFNNFLGLNKFGKTIMSYKDFAIPVIYYYINDISEEELINENDVDYDYFTEEDADELKKLIINTNKTLKLQFKKYSGLEKKIAETLYVSNFDDLEREIFNKDYVKDNYLKNIDYKEAVEELSETFDNMSSLLDFVLHYLNQIIEDYDSGIQDMNNEILDYSKVEKNLILIAFILQLIVFVIIQFFEISSVNYNLVKKIKKIRIIRKKLK